MEKTMDDDSHAHDEDDGEGWQDLDQLTPAERANLDQNIAAVNSWMAHVLGDVQEHYAEDDTCQGPGSPCIGHEAQEHILNLVTEHQEFAVLLLAIICSRLGKLARFIPAEEAVLSGISNGEMVHVDDAPANVDDYQIKRKGKAT